VLQLPQQHPVAMEVQRRTTWPVVLQLPQQHPVAMEMQQRTTWPVVLQLPQQHLVTIPSTTLCCVMASFCRTHGMTPSAGLCWSKQTAI
jgi:hypothetical protein